MRPRLQDVADRAGVSMKTVSNVINGYVHVSEAMRAKVLAAIDEVGYEPNLSARNLARGRAGMIALVVPQLDMPYFASLSMHVLEAAEKQGWVVLIQQTRGDAEKERAVLAGRFGQRVDGIVFSPLRVGTDEIRQRRDRTPLVLLGERPVDGVADHVVIDNVAAADLAVSHLLDLGRRRVAMIGGPVGSTGTHRSEGYAAALTRRGIAVDPDLVVPVHSNRGEEGEAAMDAMLARLDTPPDAVFCMTDWVALGVIRSLHLHGLRVPDDVAVVGFDDIPYSTASTPTLTSISPDRAAVAREAVASLAAQQKGEHEPREIEVGFELVVRESTAGGAGLRRPAGR
ncbi:LacI family DNA-binding transcriptional regulator [Pseudonocardia zijingensis]|jgi:DNA-binding LacI/PurR family transcriptional regulator|uniref:LacI family DNA-binding transcriptional regulator n=1 Tax=Pseudonocardia zijingensis TaxID=153376 RepID=A0ABN1NDW8_9PSEU